MFALFRYKGWHENLPRHSAVPKRQEEASAEGMLCSHPPETSMNSKKKDIKSIKPLIVLRKAGHKCSLCYCSRAGVCQYVCTALCFMDASSAFLCQKPGGLSAGYDYKNIAHQRVSNAFKSSPKEKVGVLPGELNEDWTLQHSNYHTEDGNAALLLMAFSRCFHLLHASPQTENIGKLPRSLATNSLPLVGGWQWMLGQYFPSEVTAALSRYRF